MLAMWIIVYARDYEQNIAAFFLEYLYIYVRYNGGNFVFSFAHKTYHKTDVSGKKNRTGRKRKLLNLIELNIIDTST